MFADAFAFKDLHCYSQWFADDRRLYAPVHEEPSVGREAACQILPLVFSPFDDCHYPDVIAGSDTRALWFRATVEGVALESIEHIRTNPEEQVTGSYAMVPSKR